MVTRLDYPRPRGSPVGGRGVAWLTGLTRRKVLLGCGVVAPALYIAWDIIGSLRYPGYSYVDQTVSELSATGAPTRAFMIAVNGLVYSPMVAAFGVGVWRSAGPRRAARLTGALLVGHAVIALVWWFFPMDRRQVLAAGKESWRSALHLPVGAVNVLVLLLAVGFGGALLGWRFRYYSYGTVLAALVFGALTSLQAGQVRANEPTPWAGLEERVSVYGPVLWFAALAVGLLRAEGIGVLRRLGRPTVAPQRMQGVPR